MATYSSDIITSGVVPGPPAGTVRPVLGSVSIASNTSFGTTDTIPLFSMSGPSGHIVDWWIIFPALDGGSGLGVNLNDATNTIMTNNTSARAGGIVTTANTTGATIGKAITYTTTTTVRLSVATSSTNTTGASALVIYFGFDIMQD